MLFGYPIEATAENWLHDCMVQMLQTTHDCLRNGEEAPAWPEIIPDEYRSLLRRRTTLRKYLKEYQTVVAGLSSDELERISIALINQNDIVGLLKRTCACEKIDDFPVSMRKPIRTLFEFGFKLLSDLEIRDRQYKIIFESTPYHLCPFCGCEYFDAPGAPREALDHYLAESKYPFAATNLHNLVPMGNKCNSKYKLAQDILYKEDGTRRSSFYPYSEFAGVKISLEKSIPFAGKRVLFPLPDWQLEFQPNSEEVFTWTSVFHIEERYKRDNLDSEFMSWLREFAGYCKSGKFRPMAEQDVIKALDAYLVYLRDMGVRDRAFLKLAVFEMLSKHYKAGDDRVKLLIDGVAIGGMD